MSTPHCENLKYPYFRTVRHSHWNFLHGILYVKKLGVLEGSTDIGIMNVERYVHSQ
jgi:hypothetical protein